MLMYMLSVEQPAIALSFHYSIPIICLIMSCIHSVHWNMAEHDNVLQHDVSLSIPKREMLNTVCIYIYIWKKKYIYIYMYTVYGSSNSKKEFWNVSSFWPFGSVVDNYQPAETHGTHTWSHPLPNMPFRLAIHDSTGLFSSSSLEECLVVHSSTKFSGWARKQLETNQSNLPLQLV